MFYTDASPSITCPNTWIHTPRSGEKVHYEAFARRFFNGSFQMATVCKTQVDISQGKFYLEENYMKILFSCQVNESGSTDPPMNTAKLPLDKKQLKSTNVAKETVRALSKLMNISDDLASLNFERNHQFSFLFRKTPVQQLSSSTEMYIKDWRRVARQQTLPSPSGSCVSFLVCTVFSDPWTWFKIPIENGN